MTTRTSSSLLIILSAFILILLITALAFYLGALNGTNKERLKQSQAVSSNLLVKTEAVGEATEKYFENSKATADESSRLNSALSSSVGLLEELRSGLTSEEHTCRAADPGTDWIGVLGESWAEYTDMAKEAARLADKLRALQEINKALN